MTNHYAGARKTRGTYFETLIADQAKASDYSLQDLHALVADINLDEAPDEPATPSEPLHARSEKTSDWVTYAQNNPTDPPVDLTPQSGLRDAIADHYLNW